MAHATHTTAVRHDYLLEPLDETIAEVQASVVQLRQSGVQSRDQLLDELIAAVAELGRTREAHSAIAIAAVALCLREEAA